MRTYRLGVIGANAISPVYFANIHARYPFLHLYAVCDLVKERALQAKEKYGFAYASTDFHDLLKDEKVDIVLNLTRPQQHYAIIKQALLSGKHVYTEKPLATTWKQACELVSLAQENKLLLCGAPDTYLGAGLQSCRRLIDDGRIGEVFGWNAQMLCRGHEERYPDPCFFFQKGCGPIFDIGPYYLTALTYLLGGVRRLRGSSRIPVPEKTVGCEGPYKGRCFRVESPTFVSAQLEFCSGVLGNLTLSFDTYAPQRSHIEIYGTHGTLLVPDPDTFGGPVRLFSRDMEVFPLPGENADNSRGIGLAEMAIALQEHRPASAGSQRLLHVTEILCALEHMNSRCGWIEIKSPFSRGALLSAMSTGGR